MGYISINPAIEIHRSRSGPLVIFRSVPQPQRPPPAGRRRPRRAVSGIPSPQPHNLIDAPLPPSQPHTRTHTLLKKIPPAPTAVSSSQSHSVSIRAARAAVMAAASLLEATRFLSTPHPRSRSRPLPFPPGSGLHPHLLRTPRLSTLRVHLVTAEGY
jgi:hypothetical protein